MFEEESKEYKLNLISELREKILKGYNCKELVDIERGFQKGAEFGYNKANEWNYVKDGKLPNEGESVLVLLENGSCDVSGISTDKRWLCTDYYTGEDKVIAWKEIVLPELNVQ